MKRFSDRIHNDLKAKVILNRDRYESTIENFSENGMYVRTEPIKTAVDFKPDGILGLEFQIPSGEILELNCKVKWSSKVSSDILSENLGLEIAEISPMYDNFYKSLYMSNGGGF